MNQYVTGAAIKGLRERKGLKQADLAEKLAVSDKAVSKWETGKGYPDITLLEPLAQASAAGRASSSQSACSTAMTSRRSTTNTGTTKATSTSRVRPN